MSTAEEKVNVIEAYKFSDGRIVAFLKSSNGRLSNNTFLRDDFGKQWIVKPFFHTYSVEGFQKKEQEEAQNIFEYLLQCVNHDEKPATGSILHINP